MRRPVVSLAAAALMAVVFSVPAGAEASRGSAARFGLSSIPDGAGGTYVTWFTDRDGPGDVYLQRVTADGDVAPGWPAGGLAVGAAPGMQIEAGMLPDGSGGVLVGWADFRDNPPNLFGGTADFYVQRVNAAGVPQWAANGVRALTDFNVAADLNAAPDGAGGVLFAWSLGDMSDDGDVYALRLTGSGAIAAGWNPAGILVCGDAAGQYDPVPVPDGSGGCYVVWEDDRGLVVEIYGQSLNASGVAQWTADGISLTGGNEGTSPGGCVDGAGGLLAFWLTPTTVMGQRFDAAGAEQWTSGGVTLGTAGFFAQEIRSYPDPSGGAYVVWRDQGGTGTQLVAQRVNGSGVSQWTAGGVIVCDTDGDRFLEDAVVEGDGALSLMWEDSRGFGGQNLYVRRVGPTGTPLWTANGVALATTGDKRPVSLAPDGAGGLVATWLDFRNTDVEPYAQRVNASGVVQLGANGKVVLADPGVQRGALAISDGGSGTWIVWSEKSGGQYDLRARRVDVNGAPLTLAVTVCAAAGNQWVAGAVDDGVGGVVIGWVDERAGAGESDIYARRVSGLGIPQWTADGVAVCGALGPQNELRMTADGAGSAVFAWTDYRTGSADVYAQRLDGAGAGLWTADGVPVCTATNQQTGPVVAPSGSGGAVIAWMDERSVFPPGVFAQRLDDLGAPQWTADGVHIATPVGLFNRLTDAVSDGSDGAIVVYEEQLFDVPGTGAFLTTNPIAQRVSAAGSPLWNGFIGAILCDVDGFREGTRLIPDGAGGAMAAWSDGRSGVYDVYAQRVNDIGVVLWNSDGYAICNATSWQWLSGLVSDGAGGAVLAWGDERNGFSDVYAQRIDGTGASLWAADGVVVVDAARGQYGASLHATGSTPVFVWTDFRNGSERLLYTDKLSALGVSQWAANGVTSAQFSMVAAEANPGRVRVTWAVSGDAFEVTAYRRGETEAWRSLGVLPVDGTGRVELVDETAEPGTRYAYRIGAREDGAETFSGAVWIDVPRELRLAIDGMRPQPARGDVWMSVSLPDDAPARIEVLDVGGRRVGARELAGLAAGRHVVRVPEVPAAAGVYFVVLTQGGESVRGRVVRVR